MAENEEKNEPTNPKAESRALVGFVLGLVSIIAWLLPLIGYPVTIVGIVFSGLRIKCNQK